MIANCASPSDKDQISEYVNIPNNITFSYRWIIRFEDINKEGIESCIFSNGMNTEIKWRLKILFDEESDYIVEVKLISNEVNKIKFSCNVIVWSSDEFKTWENTQQFEIEAGVYLNCFAIPCHKFQPKHSHQKIVICQINVEEVSTLLVLPKCTLVDNFELIFQHRKYTDVTLCASGKEFQAHKAILEVRSPVFKAMFEHNMQENKNSRIDIPDIESEVFEELLRFIYTGKVCNLENLASDLLPAAEKYGFEKLKVLCGKSLCTNISIENAAEIFILTDVYNLDTLKTIVKRYIASHIAEVSMTNGWNAITLSYPNLITEVLCDVAQRLHDAVIVK